MNKQIVALSDYPSFLLKWVVLQLLTISGSVSFLIFTVVQKELDVSKLTTNCTCGSLLSASCRC